MESGGWDCACLESVGAPAWEGSELRGALSVSADYDRVGAWVIVRKRKEGGRGREVTSLSERGILLMLMLLMLFLLLFLLHRFAEPGEERGHEPQAPLPLPSAPITIDCASLCRSSLLTRSRAALDHATG